MESFRLPVLSVDVQNDLLALRQPLPIRRQSKQHYEQRQGDAELERHEDAILAVNLLGRQTRTPEPSVSNQLTHDEFIESHRLKYPQQYSREEHLKQVLCEIREAVRRSDPRNQTDHNLHTNGCPGNNQEEIDQPESNYQVISMDSTSGSDSNTKLENKGLTGEPQQITETYTENTSSMLSTLQAMAHTTTSMNMRQRAITAALGGPATPFDPTLGPEHFIALLDEQERHNQICNVQNTSKPNHTRKGNVAKTLQFRNPRIEQQTVLGIPNPSKYVALRPPRRPTTSRRSSPRQFQIADVFK